MPRAGAADSPRVRSAGFSQHAGHGYSGLA